METSRIHLAANTPEQRSSASRLLDLLVRVHPRRHAFYTRPSSMYIGTPPARMLLIFWIPLGWLRRRTTIHRWDTYTHTYIPIHNIAVPDDVCILYVYLYYIFKIYICIVEYAAGERRRDTYTEVDNNRRAWATLSVESVALWLFQFVPKNSFTRWAAVGSSSDRIYICGRLPAYILPILFRCRRSQTVSETGMVYVCLAVCILIVFLFARRFRQRRAGDGGRDCPRVTAWFSLCSAQQAGAPVIDFFCWLCVFVLDCLSRMVSMCVWVWICFCVFVWLASLRIIGSFDAVARNSLFGGFVVVGSIGAIWWVFIFSTGNSIPWSNEHNYYICGDI